MLHYMAEGLGGGVLALFILRVATGAFFMLSGYHKLFNRERHASLVQTLRGDGVPMLGVMQWWVPFCEFSGGALLMVGLFTLPMALVLAILLCVACVVDGRKRVADYRPLDMGDRIDDWLYLSEVVYLFILVLLVMVGPGPLSVDHFALG